MDKITIRNTQVLINNNVPGHAENEFFLYNFYLQCFFLTFHILLYKEFLDPSLLGLSSYL